MIRTISYLLIRLPTSPSEAGAVAAVAEVTGSEREDIGVAFASGARCRFSKLSKKARQVLFSSVVPLSPSRGSLRKMRSFVRLRRSGGQPGEVGRRGRGQEVVERTLLVQLLDVRVSADRLSVDERLRDGVLARGGA